MGQSLWKTSGEFLIETPLFKEAAQGSVRHTDPRGRRVDMHKQLWDGPCVAYWTCKAPMLPGPGAGPQPLGHLCATCYKSNCFKTANSDKYSRKEAGYKCKTQANHWQLLTLADEAPGLH